MSREKELTKNTIIVSIGRICTQCISFFLLPLYTAKLSTEEYGTVDLLNTYVSLLIPIIIFEIQQAIFRYLVDNRKDEEEKEVLISTTIFSAIVQSILYLLIYCVIAQFIKNEYKYFLATNVVANIFSSIMLQISRGLGNNKVYTMGSFITASLTIILNVIFIVCLNMGAYGMLAASLISNIICSIYIVIRLKIYKYIKLKSFNFSKLKKLWKYSIPLIPNSISWWIMSASDRTIITAFLNVGANGIYSAANKFSSVFSTFYSIFSITWTESAAIHIKEDDSAEYFSKTINRVFKLFASLCFGIIGFMPFVFPIMINPNYSEAYQQIPILMLGALCNAMVALLSALYIAKKMTKTVAQTSIISAIINIVVNLALIKWIGLYAASISTFLAYFIMMLIRMKNIKKYIDIKFDKRIMLEISILAIIILILYYINNLAANIVLFIAVIIYAIYANFDIIHIIRHNSLKKIIKKLLNK